MSETPKDNNKQLAVVIVKKAISFVEKCDIREKVLQEEANNNYNGG